MGGRGPAQVVAPLQAKSVRVELDQRRDHVVEGQDALGSRRRAKQTFDRAALTGLRKRGYAVAIDRSNDTRRSVYRILTGETGLVEGPANSETARRKEQGRSEPQAHQTA